MITRITLSLLLASILIIPTRLGADTSYADVAITEILWMGSSGNSRDEWLEIGLNEKSDLEEIVLDGWSIVLQKPDEEVILTSLDGLILKKDKPLLIARLGEESALAIEPDLIAPTLKLPNTKLLLLLKNADGNSIDRVDDGIGSPFAGKNPSGGKGRASMERIDMSKPGDIKDNWRSADTSSGFVVDADTFGTPGFIPPVNEDDDTQNNDLTATTHCTYNPSIQIQSGETRAFKKVTVNVKADDIPTDAVCFWQYSDGYTSQSCNPPSHTFSIVGMHTITLYMNNICEQKVELNLGLEVLPDAAKHSHAIRTKPASDSAPCIPSIFTGVVITEILPHPQDDDQTEFIELKNNSGKEQHLCGLVLSDKSKEFSLDGLTIGDHQLLSLTKKQTRINLNNDTDTIILRRAGESGAILSQLTYQDVQPGWSYSLRDDNEWIWTPHDTPGNKNQFRTSERLFATPPLRVVSVLPNPTGVDTTGEFIEIENISGRPLLLHPFQIIVTSNDNILTTLHFQPGDALRVSEKRIISSTQLGVNLPNRQGAVAITDNNHHVLSILSWDNAEEGELIEHSQHDGQQSNARINTVNNNGIITAQIYNLPDANVGRIPLHIDIELPNILLVSGAVRLMRHALLDKQVNLEFANPLHTTNGEYRANVIREDGIDIQATLLQHGRALLKTWVPSSKQALYTIFEREARQSKLGLWNDVALVKQLLQRRRIEEQIARVQQEGVRVEVDTTPGLVTSGSLITIESNIPQSNLFVSINSGVYRLSSGVVEVDTSMHVKAYAATTILGAGAPILQSDVWEGWFSIKRDNWPTVFISEVYPAPLTDEEEWIELFNPNTTPVDLTDWLLDDMQNEGSKPWIIPAGTTIEAKSYLVFPKSQTHLTLNDGGDSVYLLNPNKEIVDTISFTKTKRGMAIASPLPGKNRRACITQKTPLKINDCNSNLALEKNKIKKPKSEKKTIKKRRSTSTKHPLRNLKPVEYFGEGMKSLLSSLSGSGKVVLNNQNSQQPSPINFIHITLLLLIGGVQIVVLMLLRGE